MPSNKRTFADVAGPPVELRPSKKVHSENAEPCSLLDLNDDCISEILSYMSEDDLIALHKSCRRMEKCTEDCVRSKYREKLFELKPTERSHDLMREFGKVLTRLTIDIQKLKNTTFVLHCTETFLFQDFTNLRELSLVDVHISEDFVNRTNALCRNLKYLSIALFERGIRNNDFQRFVLACTQLESLSVIYGMFDNGHPVPIQFLNFRYPTWKEISIRKCPFGNPSYHQQDFYYHIQEFLKQNPQIERATLDLPETGITSQVLQDVLKYSKDIKSIQIRLTEFDGSFVTDLAQLHRLHNLVELNINCKFRQIDSAIDALASTNSLETLGLAEIHWNDELVVALGKLTKLKTLKLHKTEGVTPNSVQCLSAIQQSLVHFHFVRDSYDDVFITHNLFVEYYPRMQTLTFTSQKMYSWDLLWNDNEFKKLAAARKRSTALNPLTVLLNSGDFQESMRDTPALLQLVGTVRSVATSVSTVFYDLHQLAMQEFS